MTDKKINVIISPVIYVKKKFAGLIFAFTILFSLCSCNTNILKTKEPSDKIKQTEVLLDTEYDTCPDFKIFNDTFKEEFTVPGLFEGVIPQGICCDDDKGTVVISGYYEDEAFPSVVTVTDKETGKFIKSVSLKNADGSPFFGHAGGIAYSDGYFYITTLGEAFIFSGSDLYNSDNYGSITFTNNFKLNTSGSFCNISGGTLWAGDFVENSKKAHEDAKVTTLSSGESFYAYCEGYKLTDGLPSTENLNSENTGYIPDYLMAIPDEVQGITVTPSGMFIFTTSYGRRNNSEIRIYRDILAGKKISAEKIDGKDVELIACSENFLKDKITAPPMAEGIDCSDGSIWIVFESGAAKYRSHGGKYPVDSVFSFKYD